MVFLIVNWEKKKAIMLVKAKDREEADNRLRLKDGERVVMALTDKEIKVLSTGTFEVIEAQLWRW